jgi:pimeloyl-ACP methyl ester carboxylesterase
VGTQLIASQTARLHETFPAPVRQRATFSFRSRQTFNKEQLKGTVLRRVVTLFWISLVACVLVVSGCSTARADAPKPRVIVFVHGLHGSSDTWRAANGAYWPDLIRTDPHFRNSDVVVAEYPTPSMRGRYSTAQLGELLYQSLNKQGVWEHHDIVFIAHSLGGLLTEEMLLNHPSDAAHVSFVASYATPHQGSFIASLAKIYDSDPLLTDLSYADDNAFLTSLEQRWRGSPYTIGIHRYCAYETLDTASGAGIGHYLHAHTRVVSFYSATYGCDVDTPPQKINTDHIDIVKPSSRQADAYTFFAKLYRNNPITNITETVRDNKVSALYVACDRTNSADDLQVPIALDPAQHEQLIAAIAEFVDTQKVKDAPAIAVTKVDPGGIAHIAYSFRGRGHELGIFGCPTGHTSILVHFTVRSRVPVVE